MLLTLETHQSGKQANSIHICSIVNQLGTPGILRMIKIRTHASLC